VKARNGPEWTWEYIKIEARPFIVSWIHKRTDCCLQITFASQRRLAATLCCQTEKIKFYPFKNGSFKSRAIFNMVNNILVDSSLLTLVTVYKVILVGKRKMLQINLQH
jgi:hypothetical protein